MIIQCDQCQSRFKIADEKIPPQGAAITCPKCRNRFIIKRGAEEVGLPGPPAPPSPGWMPGDVAAREAGWLPPEENAPSDPWGQPSEPGEAPPDPWAQPSDATIPQAQAPPQMPATAPDPTPGSVQVPPQTWGDEPVAETQAEPPLGAPVPQQSGGWVPDGSVADPWGQGSDSALPGGPANPGGFLPGAPSPPAAAPQPPTAPPRQRPPGQSAPRLPDPNAGSGLELDIEQPQTLDAPTMERPPAPQPQAPAAVSTPEAPGETVAPAAKAAKPVGPPTAAFRLLLGLFVVLALVGLYATLTGMTFRPSQFSLTHMTSRFEPPPTSGGLAMGPPDARFVETGPSGPRIFVLRTRVSNMSRKTRTELYVKGRLKDDDGKVLAEFEVPCGNSFSLEQLRSMRSAGDVGKAYTPLGDNLSNKRIDPGSAIGCTVIFFNAPDPVVLASYEIEVSKAGKI